MLDADSAQVLLTGGQQESSVMLQITDIVVQKTGLDASAVTIIEAA